MVDALEDSELEVSAPSGEALPLLAELLFDCPPVDAREGATLVDTADGLLVLEFALSTFDFVDLAELSALDRAEGGMLSGISEGLRESMGRLRIIPSLRASFSACTRSARLIFFQSLARYHGNFWVPQVFPILI